MKKYIYFDNAATTQLDNEVLEEIVRVSSLYANPSSIHSMGQEANAMLENAREKIANLLDCKVSEILFTSCASESNSMLLSRFSSCISSIEHSSIKEAPHKHEISVNQDGVVNIDELKNLEKIQPELVSIMHANNETGVIQPIKEIYEILNKIGKESFSTMKNIQQMGNIQKDSLGISNTLDSTYKVDPVHKVNSIHRPLFHSDAVQTIGKIEENIIPYVDYLTLSPHKFHGPKGIGILVVKESRDIKKLIYGNRERNRRGGTENIAYICAAALALEKSLKNLVEFKKVEVFRDLFEKRITELTNSLGIDIQINGVKAKRVPHISNITFNNIKHDSLLFKLDMEGICASSGSACNSGSISKSYVLKNMNLSGDAIRFSFSLYNNFDDLDYFFDRIPNILKNLQRENK